MKKAILPFAVLGLFGLDYFYDPFNLKSYKVKLYENLHNKAVNNSTFNHEFVQKIDHFMIANKLISPEHHIIQDSALSLTLKNGKTVKNLIGLGAGYDTDGSSLEGIFDFGFGFVEVGTITLEKQFSTDKDMIKYDKENNNIQSNGYPSNWGVLKTKANIISYESENLVNNNEKAKIYKDNMVGVNICAHKDVQELAPYITEKDYELCAKELLECSDYIVINLANKENLGLKRFYEPDKLAQLIKIIKELLYLDVGLNAALEYEKMFYQNIKSQTIIEPKVSGTVIGKTKNSNSVDLISDNYERTTLHKKSYTPLIFLKVEAGLNEEDQKNIAKVALESDIDGIVIGSLEQNHMFKTKIDPKKKKLKYISGAPIKSVATKALQEFYDLTQGKLLLISSGGIFTAEDAINRIKDGASLIQIYSKLCLDGPYESNRFIKEFQHKLKLELQENNLKDIKELIGINRRKN